MREKSSTPNELSTAALAKALKRNSNDLFQTFSDLGLVVRKENLWELTDKGRQYGGFYKQHSKYGQYIVWPQSISTILCNSNSYNPERVITTTELGKAFKLSPSQTNAILSELGLIEKDKQGWKVTSLGEKLGGLQFHAPKGGASYVRWPESIKNNKRFLGKVDNHQNNVKFKFSNTLTETEEIVEFRDKFRPILRATDGHYVRSRAELLIDNWLYTSELVHAYEKKLPVEEEVYSDFFIPSGKVYIEYWGFDDDPKYLARKEIKLDIYHKYNFHLIQLFDKDVQNLDDTLPRLLRGFGVTLD